VVLIHGSLVDHHAWDAVVGPLSASLQVLVYDRRGYGESTGPPRTRAVRDDAEDLARLLEHTELFPAHLVAHSYAGAVALRLAIDRPELVRSLALHEPPMVGLLEHDPSTASEARRWKEWIEQRRLEIRSGEVERASREVVNVFSNREGAWERLRPEVRASVVRWIRLWSDEFADPESTEPEPGTVEDLLIPALLTTGQQSPEFVHRISAALGALLRNAVQRSIPGAGHVPQVTTPDRFLGILTTFLLERTVPTV
jgi:pimeloyl-ACP methyl ester carboxylesterase